VKVIGPAGTVTDLPSSDPTGSGSGAPPTSSPRSSAAPTSPPASKTAPASTGSTGDAVRPGVEVKLAAAAPGRAVSLPGSAVDWISAGTQGANQTVRRQNGDQLISGPHETGNPTSVLTDGPFAVSWSGGMPEATGTGSRRWRSVSGPAGGPETGLILRAPADQKSSALVLYVGASGADGQLRTQLGAHGKVIRTRLKAGSGGYVVTIQFHTTGASDELAVNLIAGSGGSVSFAAATLR
jgi:hypothetical protein